MTIAGIRYRIEDEWEGPYVDGKSVIEGIRFMRVTPC